MSRDHDREALEQRVAELEARLVEAQKLGTVGSLASSITHEFNNILTTIINYAKLGLRHQDMATREKSLDKILAAGLRASKITTGLLAYARRGSDRRELTELGPLVGDVLFLAEKDLQIHRIRLVKQLDEGVCSLINASQIQQVVLNLVVNARQAMEGGGQITVGVRANREHSLAEILVRDTGKGIPAENLRKIFETGFSTKTADAQGQGGSGLGLALCREVIESHNGRIRVESAVGQGTAFLLKLPLAVTTESRPSSGPATSAENHEPGDTRRANTPHGIAAAVAAARGEATR